MSHRILVIDDTEDVRAVAGMALELNQDMIVRTCGSGAEGLQIAAKWKPDLILLDVQMPEMSGPETLELLRSGEQTTSIPVIFFTASVGQNDKSRRDVLLQLGAQGLISKPFDPMALAGQVEPYLSNAEAKQVPAEAQADPASTSDQFPALREDDKSLLYVSRSLLSQGQADSAIGRIVATARSKNEHRDVTGALIFTHTHFAQYLERPSQAVDQLMAVIKQDPRHTDVRLVPIPRFPRRYFEGWKMASGGSSDFVADLVGKVFENRSATSESEKLIRLMRELTNNVPDAA